MKNETAAKGQLIELRGKGWSYEKIARHTGIDQKKLLAWGIQYKDCIDAEREINRATLEEIHRRRAEASRQPGQRHIPVVFRLSTRFVLPAILRPMARLSKQRA